MSENYLKGNEILYERAIKSIKKSEVKLQPIFESFTNSLESIFDTKTNISDPKIIIKLYHNRTTVEDKYDFEQLIIEDNGLGFNEENFKRFRTWCDDRKGIKNRGAGRVQLLHFFGTTMYSSIFQNSSSEFVNRQFVLSKAASFLKQNAIIKDLGIVKSKINELKTTIRMRDILNDKDQKYYDELSTIKLKKAIISHYLPYFCTLRNRLPEITIYQYFDNAIIEEETHRISLSDIPQCDKEDKLLINYIKILDDGSTVIKTAKKEELIIKTFKIPSNQLDKNEIRITVKDEIVETKDIKFLALGKKDDIKQNRYLILLSGEYFDNIDGETRGDFEIPTVAQLKKQYTQENCIFENDKITLDSIIEETNDKILTIYPEIKERISEHEKELAKLQDMFLLNRETLNSFKHDLNETDAEILDKVYKADIAISARKDAKIKKQIDKLDSLTTGDSKYNEDFNEIVTSLVKEIPQQNRSALVRYIARRRLILELFNKILNRELSIQKNSGEEKRNFDEKLLHCLIFQQNSSNPIDSDLWLLNEEFIYFKGTSECKLKDVLIDGAKLFEDNLEYEEIKYLNSLGENRCIKRPDILLFPEEGKCIIIEFKNPAVSVRTHLAQVDFYAGLIRNFTKNEYNLDTFYGYLIGQAIEPIDVRLTDPRYTHSYHFDYLYRPPTTVAGDIFPPKKRNDGSLYVEVIKYTSLLKRAITRNKLFIEKLNTGNIDIENTLVKFDNLLPDAKINTEATIPQL